MKYDSWEDMVDAQAQAFMTLCNQNPRLVELADKADENGYNALTPAERDEFFLLMEKTHDNPFFSLRCEREWEEMEI